MDSVGDVLDGSVNYSGYNTEPGILLAYVFVQKNFRVNFLLNRHDNLTCCSLSKVDGTAPWHQRSCIPRVRSLVALPVSERRWRLNLFRRLA